MNFYIQAISRFGRRNCVNLLTTFNVFISLGKNIEIWKLCKLLLKQEISHMFISSQKRKDSLKCNWNENTKSKFQFTRLISTLRSEKVGRYDSRLMKVIFERGKMFFNRYVCLGGVWDYKDYAYIGFSSSEKKHYWTVE